ncbi:helix-turn-helix transcriptional regulator [Paenibacillus sp. N3.4]|uniref:helix-turn-helix transcriptional regulator n=1 Tax=Paenibacillus sp. N3.4 TaxID=2603222 RepID=UPI0011C97581|nr:helix-turn-helix transcriptional regulator [Paenibacillus sp. N3.4]TXK75443.1 helix-turn-helix transcriptional regulator [Paenibacillus sp. N3.4]
MKNNIKAIRKIRNISQQVIADALGVTITAVNKWENNLTIKIPDKRVKQIAEVLGVNEGDIYSEELDEAKIKMAVVQGEIEKLQKDGYVVFNFVNDATMDDRDYDAINERFEWKRSMYPIIESFVNENFSKALTYKDQVVLGKNMALYLSEDSDKLEFLQRVVQFLSDSDASHDADLVALYEKHKQKNLPE